MGFLVLCTCSTAHVVHLQLVLVDEPSWLERSVLRVAHLWIPGESCWMAWQGSSVLPIVSDCDCDAVESVTSFAVAGQVGLGDLLTHCTFLHMRGSDCWSRPSLKILASYGLNWLLFKLW